MGIDNLNTAGLSAYKAANFASLQTRLANIAAMKPKGAKEDRALREQTDAFESLVVKVLLDTSLKMEDGLFPKQPGSDMYASMYKETLAKSLSGGFGYSELLYNFLKERQNEQK